MKVLQMLYVDVDEAVNDVSADLKERLKVSIYIYIYIYIKFDDNITRRAVCCTTATVRCLKM